MFSNAELQTRITNLEARLNVNAQGGYRPTQFEYETEVPSVDDLRVIGTQVEGSWSGALTWIEPQNKEISGYEIWAKNVSSESAGWVKKGEVTQPPWSDTIVTDAALTVQFAVRTKFRNGLGMTIENSPTVPVSILAPSVSITDPSQVGPNVIGDSAFLRTGGDAIAIANADIISLQATKITAGTLVAGVIYANAIAASQIQAGTISVALALTAPNITSTSGSNVITLNNGVITSSGAGSAAASIGAGVIQVENGSQEVDISSTTVAGFDGVNAAFSISMSAGDGLLRLYNSGSLNMTLNGTNGTIDCDSDITAGGDIQGVNINATGAYEVDSTTVINTSGAFVGAGVDVGSNGVGCGGVNISGGYTGQTVTFNAFPTQMVFRGGVLTSYTP